MVKTRAGAGGVEGACVKTDAQAHGSEPEPRMVKSGQEVGLTAPARAVLPPCLPHGVADCPVCLAEAEKIVDERLADSNPSYRLCSVCFIWYTKHPSGRCRYCRWDGPKW